MPARAPSPPEQRLTAYAGAIRHRPLGWRALWVHLSRLKEADAAQVKETALRVLAPIVRQRPGEVFELASGDLVLMVEGVTPDDMAGLAHTIGFMAGAFRRDGLATAFDLNRDFAPFEALLKNLAFPVPPEAPSEPVAAKPAAAPAASAARAPVWQPIAQPQPPAAPQAPKGLIERRAICAAFGDETLQRHGVHLRANIEAAIAAFAPGLILESNPALPRWMEERAARAMLEQLTEGDPARHGGAWIELPWRALLSPEFLRFARAIVKGGANRPRLLLQNPWTDETETAGLNYAIAFARAKAFRLGAADVPLAVFAVREDWRGLELAEISATPGDLGLGDAAVETLSRAVGRFGRGRILFSGVSDARTLGFAQGVGLTLFRGPYVDTLRSDAA